MGFNDASEHTKKLVGNVAAPSEKLAGHFCLHRDCVCDERIL
jgi:hypothetical protein